jgi:hypothetical protein
VLVWARTRRITRGSVAAVISGAVVVVFECLQCVEGVAIELIARLFARRNHGEHGERRHDHSERRLICSRVNE